jgi:hypothetical protein
MAEGADLSTQRRVFHMVLEVERGRVVPVLFLTEHHAMKAQWGTEA